MKELQHIVIIDNGKKDVEKTIGLLEDYNISARFFKAYSAIGLEKILDREDADLIVLELNLESYQGYKAFKAIQEIAGRGHLPIVAGGTFFYVDTLLGKITSPDVPPNPKLRAQLETQSADTLYAMLLQKDPKRAKQIDPQNARRIIRALEIVEALGKVPNIPATNTYHTLTLGIMREKEELRERFRLRAQQWLAQGFMEEIERLLASGITESRLKEIGFEYLLALELYHKNIDEDIFLQKFVEKNWQYAKKQRMWLQRDSSIIWVHPHDTELVYDTVGGFLY